MSSKPILEALEVAQDAYSLLGIRSVEEDVLREDWEAMRDRVAEIVSATVEAMMGCGRVVRDDGPHRVLEDLQAGGRKL